MAYYSCTHHCFVLLRLTKAQDEGVVHQRSHLAQHPMPMLRGLYAIRIWCSQSRLAKARNEGSHPDVPHPAQHPILSAAFGIAQTLPTAILVLSSITVLQNTKINRY